MIEKEKELWNRISAFEFDYKEAKFNFSHRLAKENNWTVSYSKTVIEEYKKYIFLCCTAQNGATPSDQVDQAWHLHLTYTKSYWIDFCQNTLNREVHHNPTQGGQVETAKFNDYYTRTLEAYQTAFGASPPIDIWPNNEERFADINFRRVNTNKHWIVQKPTLNLKKVFLQFAIPMACLSLIQASTSSESSFGTVIFIIIVFYLIYHSISNNNKNGKNNSGCSSGGCGSSCSSSGSGCSSGCGGCGGGD